MTRQRFDQLMKDQSLSLTPEEIAEGWHFCNEFDGLLVKGNPAEEYCGQACIDAERGPHPSHVTRFSDASTYDEICVNCGATDVTCGGWGMLANPCPSTPHPDALPLRGPYDRAAYAMVSPAGYAGVSMEPIDQATWCRMFGVGWIGLVAVFFVALPWIKKFVKNL